MYSISGTTIKLTRGDTLSAEITVMNGEEVYVPAQGDEINFYLKHNKMDSGKTQYIDQTPLITKGVPTGTMLLTLDPDDTKDLAFGDYVYDLEMTFANGDVDTFINNAKFTLIPEVG